MDKKKIILSIIVVVVLVLVVALIMAFGKNTSNNKNDVNPNNNNTVISNTNNNDNNEEEEEDELPTVHIDGEETFETLTFSDIKIMEQSASQNLLVATVTNNSEEDIASKVIDVELFTEDGSSIGIVGGILPNVAAKGTATIEIPIAVGVMNTASIKVKNSGN